MFTAQCCRIINHPTYIIFPYEPTRRWTDYLSILKELHYFLYWIYIRKYICGEVGSFVLYLMSSIERIIFFVVTYSSVVHLLWTVLFLRESSLNSTYGFTGILNPMESYFSSWLINSTLINDFPIRLTNGKKWETSLCPDRESLNLTKDHCQICKSISDTWCHIICRCQFCPLHWHWIRK